MVLPRNMADAKMAGICEKSRASVQKAARAPPVKSRV